MSAAVVDLERRIDRFAPSSASISACGDELRRHGVTACTFDELGLGAGAATFSCEDATLREVLAAIVERNPHYRWDVALARLVNVFPESSVLDRASPELDISDKSALPALEEDVELPRHGITILGGLDSGGPPIELVARPRDLRDALNLVVAQLPDTAWHISGRDGAYALSLTVVEPADG